MRWTMRTYDPSVYKMKSKEWGQIIALSAPLVQTGDVLSLGGKVYLSMAAHARHTHLLLVRKEYRLDLTGLFLVCAQLSYRFDGPIVPELADSQDAMKMPASKELNRRLKRLHWRGIGLYRDALEESAETCGDLYAPAAGAGGRFPRHTSTKWEYCDLPQTDGIKRALLCYWSGLLTVPVPGRIINFWRTIEAITTKPRREQLFDTLATHRIAPVHAQLYRDGSYSGTFNTTTSLQRRARHRRRQLLGAHGTSSAVMHYLHAMRRSKAAHADVFTLEYDDALGFSAQLDDMDLLRCLARLALELA